MLLDCPIRLARRAWVIFAFALARRRCLPMTTATGARMGVDMSGIVGDGGGAVKQKCVRADANTNNRFEEG